MSEAKFTKAPWKIQDDGYGLIGVLFRKGYGVLVGHKDNESISNAHLIAAAPEMYEEIERDIGWLGMMKAKFVLGSYEYKSICLRIESKQKLLAKARGEHNA